MDRYKQPWPGLYISRLGSTYFEERENVISFAGRAWERGNGSAGKKFDSENALALSNTACSLLTKERLGGVISGG